MSHLYPIPLNERLGEDITARSVQTPQDPNGEKQRPEHVQSI
jgi:hypothetical protein